MAEGKKCDKCGKEFKGFGTTCKDCRSTKRQGTITACDQCGGFISGGQTTCDDCKAQREEAKKIGAGKGIANKAWDDNGVPFEDTNVAGIGSDEDKAARKNAALTERAWWGVGNEPGLWVWRIEQFQVKPWPKEKYGKFHEGDSYICLHVEKEINEETGEETGGFERDIHFWLGKKTSTDEKGTAAYKTVELDDFFDGEPTQHREVQGIESQEFHHLFPKGIEYLAGGTDSGFAAAGVDVFIKKLIQVRRNAQKHILFEEEKLERASLNHRDAFIVDAGKTIYVWYGDDCSPFVKNACITKAENMESERDGDGQVQTEIDDAFWELLGGKGDITPSDQVPPEVAADFGEGVLYSINVNEKRDLEVKEVGRGDLHYSMLDPTAVMMLDTRRELFVWLGEKASEIEHRMAFKTASDFLKTNDRDPDTTPITVLKQGKGRKNKIWNKTFKD